MFQIICCAFKIKIVPRALPLYFEKNITYHFFVPAICGTQFLRPKSSLKLDVIGINGPEGGNYFSGTR